jgi:hypothetical protein
MAKPPRASARIARPTCEVRARGTVWIELTSGSSRPVRSLFRGQTMTR